MKYSVLMSVYWKDNPDYFRSSIDSIINQTVKPSEIVIVEDGPVGKELHEIISEIQGVYDHLKLIQLKENQGLGKALNEGLQHCTYDLIARMDSDDIAKTDRMQREIEVFNLYPEIDVVSAWIDEFEGDTSNVTATKKLPEYPYEIMNFAKRRCPINHPVAMFRKNAVLLAGGYCHFKLFEDYYLWARMLLNGSKFYNIQESLLWFRTSNDMYKRRGGLKHAFNEIRFQDQLRKMHFISVWQEITNIMIRFTTRIIPNKYRKLVYTTFLRK